MFAGEADICTIPMDCTLFSSDSGDYHLKNGADPSKTNYIKSSQLIIIDKFGIYSIFWAHRGIPHFGHTRTA